MALNAYQLSAELQRKKNLGLVPTSAANVEQYNKMTAQTTPSQNKKSFGNSPASTPQAGQMGTRQYLQDHGVNNADIGFNNGQVTIKGTGFITPSSNVNGQSYATNNSLNDAWNQYQLNQGQQKVNSLISDYEKAINTPYAAYTPAQQFTYNKDTDPAYQAALQSAMAGAQTAQNNAMVGLGSRGIGNSSSAVTAANQIQQNALGAVTRDVLPQLISQAYQRYADAENQRYQQYRDQYGMSRDHLNNLGSLMSLQSGLNQQSIDNRRNDKLDNWAAANQVSNATGKLVSPQSDWSGLIRQAQSANTPLTLAGQNQQFGQDVTMAGLTGYLPNGQKTNAQQQQDLQNLWTIAEQTGTIPNQLADLYGIPRRTQTQAAKQYWNNYNRGVLESDRNYGLQLDDNDRQWVSLDAQLGSDSRGKGVSGDVAGNILTQSLQKIVGNEGGKPVYGVISDPTTREKAFIDAWNSSGVAPGTDTVTMLSKAGYTAQEIAELKRKYPAAFNSGGTSGGNGSPAKVSVPSQYRGMIETSNDKYGLPAGLLGAVASAESSFNPNSKNRKSGAAGMFQFMPATAKSYGIDPLNPVQAADAAGKMLSGLAAKYDGDYSKALAAYNWGGGNVDKALKKYGANWMDYAPSETRAYIKKILG